MIDYLVTLVILQLASVFSYIIAVLLSCKYKYIATETLWQLML